MKISPRLAALALCFGPICSAASAADVIRLGNLKFVHYGTIFYMKEIAPKHGLEIQETVFAKGIDMLPGLMRGEIDLAASAAEGAIEARAAGAPVYVVAGFAAGGARIVGRSDVIWKSSKDLRGKRVGVTRGGAHEMLLLAELASNGLSWSAEPGQDVQLVFLPYPKLNDALERREVDAVCHTEPQGSQAITKGFGVEITKPYRTMIGEPVRTLVMSEKLYNDRPLALRVMACFAEATKTFLEQPEIAERYIRETVFGGKLTAEDYKLAFSNARFNYEIAPVQIQALTDFMIYQRLGVVINALNRPQTAEEWVRTDLLAEAKLALGIVAPTRPAANAPTPKPK